MARFVKLITFFALMSLLFGGCVSMEQGSDPTDELAVLWQQFEKAWNALDAETCASFYAEDGVNIPPELAIREGREAVTEFYRWLFSMHTAADYHHEILEVSYTGTLAVEQGRFRVNWTSQDGSQWTYSARSLTHWQREPGEPWKIRTFIFNPAPEV